MAGGDLLYGRLGIRPTLFDMGQRLADDGYVALLPDLFYRAGPYEPLEPKKVFATGDVRKTIAHLSARPTMVGRPRTLRRFWPISTRGRMWPARPSAPPAIAWAAPSRSRSRHLPNRIAAVASFHGGNLATDSELSPHLRAPAITGRVYVAGADQDSAYPPEMAERLERALGEAGVDHLCEIYPGALHGWTMADFPVYDEAAAERQWRALLDLLDNVLH